jgi:iron(II)-dependent oxidoreductase
MATATTSNLEEARAQTLALVDAVNDDDLERVHSNLMSPLVWDLGHIAAFEDLWLCHRDGGLALLHPELMDVYDAFETPRAERGELPYLRRAEAEEFLAAVRERTSALAAGPHRELVARHERQHAETMLQTLNLARLEGYEPPGLAPDSAGAPASGLDLVAVDGAGAFPLGAPAGAFAYDNERPQHAVAVAPFSIGRRAVTNGDWQEFVAGGGYARREWWDDDGWAWRAAEGVERPLNWLDDEREWRLGRGAAPIAPERPVVHVSWFEASAFARSHGLRLPTEAEWELAATWDGSARHEEQEQANLLESAMFCTTGAGSASPCGALGMIGDVWEWTSSEFRGYPGFAADPYPEYSEVFFGEGYRVLRGGSFASSAAVITPSFRNWDHPQRRQIFAGLRVAA